MVAQEPRVKQCEETLHFPAGPARPKKQRRLKSKRQQLPSVSLSDEHRAASGGISSTFCRSGPCLRYSDPECRLPSKCSESIFVEVAQRCKAQVVSSGPYYPLYVLQSDAVRSIAYPRRRARNAPMIGLCRVLRIVSGWSSSSDNFQTINTHYAEGFIDWDLVPKFGWDLFDRNGRRPFSSKPILARCG